ncbi:Eukaryotic translation initiation factor 3 subunit A [Lachnellula subtilissima]|uniref:Eukaryotic translation initiation factor 3 subunit A n=1 Tax=Lachnellula subtilissima TaxID=602034 RepID=A0A8H8RZB4_9HELO|nr:Eukaryotic translation initiation factor 3 subunit A [Lachnellula subtilissima]
MPPPPHAKPENVLKRAHELMGVGQSPAALVLLHEHITSKRSRNVPITSLEPVMVLLVEQSVEQKKGKLAKDALYQYKNISQNTNVGTIELVLKKFIELAEEKVKTAQAKADEVQSSLETTADTAGVDDLEASETPESILLSTVSGEQSRDRTDRAIVTPWLKFLWETYRTVLDILRNNARLEIMYQSTAMQAFEFCQKYTRKTEFRRLCELLRNHVQTAAKYSAQMHAINLNDPDTLQRHLETRFQQLNVAVELELWQEAFRSVEDIHTLLNLSKRPPKNVMMANYYEKLTRIFLVGENYLFHAAAWSRYYNLLRQSASMVASGQSKKADNPATSEADLSKAASFVLLSALAIPVISTSRSRGALVDIDEAKKNKNSRLTHLLGMAQAPTRAVLFRDAMSKGLLKRARPEIRELYNILEVDFHPLSICQKISPILTKIGADEELAKYVLPLQQVILTRLFQQLSQVYETVDLAFVENLARFPEPFQVSRDTIEKFIMNGNKKGDLAIRMDHATGVLSFDTDVFSSTKAVNAGTSAGSAESETSSVQRLQNTPSEIVRTQLTRLAKSLFVTCQYIDPSYNEARIKARDAAYAKASAGAEQEHHDILARKEVITKRKEEASEIQARKEKEDATRKRIRAAQIQEAEDKRLAQEQKDREEKRMKAELDRVRKEELKKQIADLKIGPKAIDIDMDDLDNIDSNRIRAMKLAQLEREKNDMNEKLRITAKRIDHIERAQRKEEAKKLPADYAAQRERDLEAYEKTKAQTLEDAEAKHEHNVALSKRLARVVPYYESFRETIVERRRDEFERSRRKAEKDLQDQMDARRKEFRARKAREKRELEEQDRILREEEERAAREAEEKAARDEQKRKEFAELKATREKERSEALAIAELQERRATEAAARRQEARTAVPSRGVALDRGESGSGSGAVRPPLPLAGAKLGWREKERLRSEGKEVPGPTRTESPAARASPMGRPAPAPMERTDSNDRPAERGPPRLALSGGKPSWREREAAKGTSGGEPAAPSRVPPPMDRGRSRRDDERDESPAPAPAAGDSLKPSGTAGKFVPPHLRNKA